MWIAKLLFFLFLLFFFFFFFCRYSILASIQFDGFSFPCRGGSGGGGGDGGGGGEGQGEGSGVTLSCPALGSDIMAAYNFDTLPLYANIIILAGLTVGFRLLAYCALYKTTQP